MGLLKKAVEFDREGRLKKINFPPGKWIPEPEGSITPDRFVRYKIQCFVDKHSDSSTDSCEYRDDFSRLQKFILDFKAEGYGVSKRFDIHDDTEHRLVIYRQEVKTLMHASVLLSRIEYIPPGTWYLAQTPDGVIGRDINGFFVNPFIRTGSLHLACGRQKMSRPVYEEDGFSCCANKEDKFRLTALLKEFGYDECLTLLMKCGRCGYESPVHTRAGSFKRECYCCGAKNNVRRDPIKVETGSTTVEI